jgi:hypothetical protein
LKAGRVVAATASSLREFHSLVAGVKKEWWYSSVFVPIHVFKS